METPSGPIGAGVVVSAFGFQGQKCSACSRVIVDAKNGYVITNHHVIKDASEVAVTLKDNRRFPAQLVGSDAGTDADGDGFGDACDKCPLLAEPAKS